MKASLASGTEFDVPIETAFTQISKSRICMIMKLLLEHHTVFACALSHELFASLLFPLRWRHSFIPLMCIPMAETLEKTEDIFVATDKSNLYSYMYENEKFIENDLPSIRNNKLYAIDIIILNNKSSMWRIDF